MTEAELLKRLMLRLSDATMRVFRNHVGLGWQGEVVRFARSGKVLVEPGDVLVRKARPLSAGLCTGSSDLIGWKTVDITPDMLGRRVAIFAAIEGKSERGRLREEQERFLAVVRRAGGIAVEAREVEETVAQINEQRRGTK